MANGQQLNVLGGWQTIREIENLKLVCELIVARDAGYAVLVGTDFLTKYGVVLDLRDKTYTILGKKKPVVLQGSCTALCRVVVLDDITIPSRTEILIAWKVERIANSNGLERLIKPSDYFTDRHNLLMACSLGTTKTVRLWFI